MADNDSNIAPGQSKTFIYVGQFIPNQVNIQNLSQTSQANYTVKSGPHPWTYYGLVPPGKTQAIQVHWPTGVAVFGNVGGGTINVYGDGLRPAAPGEEEKYGAKAGV
jgi:hypothetical protein